MTIEGEEEVLSPLMMQSPEDPQEAENINIDLPTKNKTANIRSIRHILIANNGKKKVKVMQ